MKSRRADGGAPSPGCLPPSTAVGPVWTSHARLSKYEHCPRAYRYRYVDRRPERLRSAEAVTGEVVHEVLRRLYAYVQGEGRVPGLDAVLARTRATFAEAWGPAVSIVARGMTRELYAVNAERFVANYYARAAPFDEPVVMLEGRVEGPVGQLPDGRWLRFFGYVDRIGWAGGHYRIHDYKTGKRVLSQSEADDDRQLALYAIGLRCSRMPPAPVESTELVWHFLAYGVEMRSARSESRLVEVQRRVLEVTGRIEADREYPARPGPLCAWCDFRAICPDAKR